MLRRVAKMGDEQERLNTLEREFFERERQKPQPITAAQRIFMELLQPMPPPVAMPVQTAAVPARADVLQILNHPSDASIAELEDVLRRSKDMKLSSREEESIRQLLSQLAGERFRGESKPSELKRLGWKETPNGPIDPQTVRGFESLRVTGLQAIESCANHQGASCYCFSSLREALWQIRSAYSKHLPENWLAERILEELNIYSQQTMVHQKRCS
jgi:hypothetical protein